MSSRKQIAMHPLGAAPGTGQHVALVPGAEVPLLALDLPARLRGPAREDVARRQLRDRIGVAGEHVEMRPFFAPGRGEHWHRALVADGARLAAWRAGAGPGCRAVLPDYLALPVAAGLWSVQIENGSVQARLGLEDGFSADPDLARLMLARALEDGDIAPPRAVLLQGEDAEITALMAARDIPVVRDAAALSPLGLARPEALAHGELAFDLRADPRAARETLRRRVLPWRWPLLIGLLASGLWAAAQVVATQALEAETRAERDATLALVRRHFVPTGPVLDVRTQVARALAERQDAARDWQGRVSPLTLFGQVARVVSGAGAVSGEYTYERDSLTAVLRLEDFAAAEALVTALRDAGLGVEVVDLRVSDSATGVRAELRLRADP
ncbi:type II secretion system protein GspL [Puniceibacterium confluentis]|uniref:type II secretion system protein GspL n=1 Tax=Puniceibacterium confluentis TaxID=1958944 RepID=UPI0011B42D29|nr:type II secretion system protein GspL [Puniceibacterium confluentis]